MIITRTPLRISLVGGGTDMPGFFTREFGAVVSFTIDKYVYIAVNKKFDGRVRVSYSVTENVDTVEEVKHDIVREALKHFEVRNRIEVVSISDIPGGGSGLGSSSAFAVGLAKGLRMYQSFPGTAYAARYAHEAFMIERQLCKHPVGLQDHYAATFGGINYFQFNPDGSVEVEPFQFTLSQLEYLEENLLLFYLGSRRSAKLILQDQEENLTRGEGAWIAAVQLRDLAVKLRDEFREGQVENVGHYLHEGWNLKKRMGSITTQEIDRLYDRAREAGAIGGKICGAGGGGFMVFAAEPGTQKDVEAALGLRRMPFMIESLGSCVIYNG